MRFKSFKITIITKLQIAKDKNVTTINKSDRSPCKIGMAKKEILFLEISGI